jgi:hypothetical protein
MGLIGWYFYIHLPYTGTWTEVVHLIRVHKISAKLSTMSNQSINQSPSYSSDSQLYPLFIKGFCYRLFPRIHCHVDSD